MGEENAVIRVAKRRQSKIVQIYQFRDEASLLTVENIEFFCETR